MPKRQLKRIDTSEIQGDGSYIVLRSLTWGEVKDYQKRARDDEFDEMTDTEQILSTAIVEWNWVDYDGEPFPLPRDDNSVVERLLVNEVKFIVSAVLGGEDTKN